MSGKSRITNKQESILNHTWHTKKQAFPLQNSISVLPILKNIYSSNTFSLMITWVVCSTIGSIHRNSLSVSSQSWAKWPLMLPGEANSMGGPCQPHHLLPVPHLLMSMRRPLVGSIPCIPGQIPGVIYDVRGCLPPVPLNLFLSQWHSHTFTLTFLVPWNNFLFSLYCFFPLALSLLRGLEGLIMVGLAPGTKRESDS